MHCGKIGLENKRGTFKAFYIYLGEKSTKSEEQRGF